MSAIVPLTLQPPFPIYAFGTGIKVAVYYADFEYIVAQNGEVVTEDVKGMKTAVYRLKKRLVESQYGIQIREVR